MSGQQNEKIETLQPGTSVPVTAPDPTAEEAQRTAALANESTDSPPAREPDTSQQPKDPALKNFEDPRAKIAADWRSRRATEMQGDTEDFNDKRLVDPVTQAQSEQQLAEAAESGQVSSQEQPAPARQMVKVKVDGKEIEVPMEDLVRNYQIDKTADARLQAATAAQKAAEALLAKASGTAGQQAPTNPGHESGSDQSARTPTGEKKDDPTPDGADVSDQELMDVVEKMMTGSTDEAFKALKNVVKRPAPTQQPADIATEVDKAIAVREENRKSAAALDKFGEKYKAAKTDRVVEAALSQLIRDEMVSDLREANVPNEFIEHFKLNEPEGRRYLMESHRQLRAAGHAKARSAEQILERVEKNPGFLKLVATSAQPSPQINVNRQERKETVQAQPALRSAAPQPTGKPQPANREEAKQSAFQKAKAARGQMAYGA